MDTEFNPYQAPRSDVMVRPGDGGYHVDGRDLICSAEVVLPARCIKTNEEVDGSQIQSKTLYWINPWLYLLIFVQWVILVILYFVLRKRVKVTFGLGKTARRKRAKQMAGFWLLFLLAFFGLISGAATEVYWVVTVGCLALIGSLIWLAVAGSVIRPVKYLPSGEFVMRGCGSEFLASLEQELRSQKSAIV